VPITIQVNGTNLTLVHKFSNGISTATVPDVCKTPTPGGPVPMPYPNIAQSITLSNGTTTVKGDKAMAANKGSKFALSNGDQPGTIGGVKSNVFMKEATWILYSFDVKLQSKNASRFTDPMFHNAENTVNMSGEVQVPRAAASVENELARQMCEEVCRIVRANFTKRTGPQGGQSWERNPGGVRTNWSQQLEATLRSQTSRWSRFAAGAQQFLTGPLAGQTVNVAFTATRGIPPFQAIFDCLLEIGGQPYRSLDFKFPGDSFRGDQFDRQYVITGKEPRKIGPKEEGGECDCG
jgi:hypothetical protein